MNRRFSIYSDGACSGNPGPAGVGVVIKEGENVVKEISRPIGDATNNIAEYTALIYALQEALILHADDVQVFTDSELLFKQVKGLYQVKEPGIKRLFDQLKHLMSGFQHLEIQHIPREKNKDADRLAKQAIKKKSSAPEAEI